MSRFRRHRLTLQVVPSAPIEFQDFVACVHGIRLTETICIGTHFLRSRTEFTGAAGFRRVVLACTAVLCVPQLCTRRPTRVKIRASNVLVRIGIYAIAGHWRRNDLQCEWAPMLHIVSRYCLVQGDGICRIGSPGFISVGALRR